MEAILNLIPGGWLTAAGGGLVAVLLALWRAFAAGKAAERGRQSKRDLKAAEDRLEMHREASEIERRARDLTDDQARQEAERWARR